MTEPTEPDDGDELDDADDADGAGAFVRGIDTALGATARVVRATTEAAEVGERVARAMGAATVGRIAGNAARALTEPLAREGAVLRGQIEDEFPDAARDLSARVVPAVVETIDPQVVLESIDLDAILAGVDMNRLLASVDLDALLARIDVSALLERIDMSALLDRIDVDEIVNRVDVDRIISRVDVDEIVNRVDVDRIIQRVDVDAIIGRVDIAEVVGRVDVDQLVSRTEIGGLIAKSTSGVVSQALDVVRQQGVGLDTVIARAASRLMRRDPTSMPAGPRLLIEPTRPQLSAADTSTTGATS